MKAPPQMVVTSSFSCLNHFFSCTTPKRRFTVQYTAEKSPGNYDIQDDPQKAHFCFACSPAL